MLTIVVPTYNRSQFINLFLDSHKYILKNKDINIIISDNSNNDQTYDVCKDYLYFENFKYFKNKISTNADESISAALKRSKSKYTWLMGDTYYIDQANFDKAFKIISKQEYDFLIINLQNKLKLSSSFYSNKNLLLYDLGGLMTCMSCLVYSDKILKFSNHQSQFNSNFIQLGIIFDYIKKNKFLCYWLKDSNIKLFSNKLVKKRNWSYSEDAFKIGCEKWSNFMNSYSTDFDTKAIEKCLKDFSLISGLFTFSGLIKLRVLRILNIYTFYRYKNYLKKMTNIHSVLIIIISIYPSKLLLVKLRFFNFFLKNERLSTLVNAKSN